MASSQVGEVVQQYSCRCHNITINAHRGGSTASTSKPDTEYHSIFVGEDGIHINHHYLTLRTRDRAQELKGSQNKLLQHLTLYCLACKTPTYRVAQEISRGHEAREGPIVPTEDWVEQETLVSKSGWIEVFLGQGGCLVGKDVIQEHFRSLQLSRTFAIGVLSSDTPKSPPIESSPASQPWLRSSTDDSTKHFSTDTQLLPTLPPLFPPPPFTPSHPVFLSLAAFASGKSTDLRQQAEEETRAFAKGRLDVLEKEEAELRKEVEGIWRAYREGWKEVLGRVNEERRRSLPPKSDSSTLIASAKSGVPMSIRDFHPIIRPHTQGEKLPHTPSTSLLSASLMQTGTHLPPNRSLAPETAMSGSAAQQSNSGAHDTSTDPPSRVNGNPNSASPSSSPHAHDDPRYYSAFKRNMDTSVDIASSMAWTQGEEEMRRRFKSREDGQPKDRARKRTSKNLGIGAVEATSAPKQEEEADPATKDKTQTSSSGNPGFEQVDSVSAASTSKAKRRVTFDVQPEVTFIHKTTPRQHSQAEAEVELFDFDLPFGENTQESDVLRSSRSAQPQPITLNASYKLWSNEGGSASRPASLPAHRAIHPRSPNGVTNWNGGFTKRFVGLADALPLLSSSVPAADFLPTRRWPETSTHEEIRLAPTTDGPSQPMNGTNSHGQEEPDMRVGIPFHGPPSSNREYAEAELKNLLAASAPSHRHAWKEGGKAWEMFYRRAREKKKKAKGAIDEEASGGGSPDEDSDGSSNESQTDGKWRNPSQFASSLPVQIHPMPQYQSPLARKTSLTDKHGVLVPPLKVTNGRPSSSTAIRRAMYAERDRARSIDPGPALDFDEQEELEVGDEDEDGSQDIISDGERARHHALSILQARSVVPEAGMWRSMTS